MYSNAISLKLSYIFVLRHNILLYDTNVQNNYFANLKYFVTCDTKLVFRVYRPFAQIFSEGRLLGRRAFGLLPQPPDGVAASGTGDTFEQFLN
jgi:hypothetical protein